MCPHYQHYSIRDFLSGLLALRLTRSELLSWIPTYFNRRNFFSVGLDAAGKTTILYKLKLGEIVTTIPTIGKTALKMSPVFSVRLVLIKWDYYN